MDEEIPTFDIDWEDISYEEMETISIAETQRTAMRKGDFTKSTVKRLTKL